MSKIPLDPKEGPTVWLNKDCGNKHTVQIIVGTDPENPRKEIVLSKNEIKNMYGELIE